MPPVTTTYREGACGLIANSVTVENCTFAYNALCRPGLVHNPNCTIDANTCAFNGAEWLGCKYDQRVVVENNVIAYNNQRNFAQNWATGGSKIGHSTNVTMENNLYDSNNCDGMWFDLSCSNITIVGNTILNSARDRDRVRVSLLRTRSLPITWWLAPVPRESDRSRGIQRTGLEQHTG